MQSISLRRIIYTNFFTLAWMVTLPLYASTLFFNELLTLTLVLLSISLLLNTLFILKKRFPTNLKTSTLIIGLCGIGLNIFGVVPFAFFCGFSPSGLCDQLLPLALSSILIIISSLFFISVQNNSFLKFLGILFYFISITISLVSLLSVTIFA